MTPLLRMSSWRRGVMLRKCTGHVFVVLCVSGTSLSVGPQCYYEMACAGKNTRELAQEVTEMNQHRLAFRLCVVCEEGDRK
jgi:hypothetical protein